MKQPSFSLGQQGVPLPGQEIAVFFPRLIKGYLQSPITLLEQVEWIYFKSFLVRGFEGSAYLLEQCVQTLHFTELVPGSFGYWHTVWCTLGKQMGNSFLAFLSSSVPFIKLFWGENNFFLVCEFTVAYESLVRNGSLPILFKGRSSWVLGLVEMEQ